MSEAPLLYIDKLSVSLQNIESQRVILDRLSLKIYQNEIVGLVGESGSGKTMTALTTMRLLPNTIKATGGSVWFEGQDLLKLSAREMHHIRGKKIAMIFQNPAHGAQPLDAYRRSNRTRRQAPP